MKSEHGLDCDERLENHYNSVAASIYLSFSDSPFWQQLPTQLRDRHEAYLLDTEYPLMQSPAAPPIVTKPYTSFLEKTFRRNVLSNDRWPDSPADGWLIPDRCHDSFNDIARTTLVVRYLDGVEYLVTSLAEWVVTCGLECTASFEASEEGYYAAHLIVSTDIPVPKMTFDSVTITANLEIQITTQLQDVIKRLLHTYYEEARLKVPTTRPDPKWQWNYRSDEFLTNYLGHILHYVEGMIIEVRERQHAAKPSISKPGG